MKYVLWMILICVGIYFCPYGWGRVAGVIALLPPLCLTFIGRKKELDEANKKPYPG